MRTKSTNGSQESAEEKIKGSQEEKEEYIDKGMGE